MIQELTRYETAEDFTNDLRERLQTDIPYGSNVPNIWLPNEPYVIVEEIIEPYNNYRSFVKDNKFIIPIATYVDGCRSSYTQFDEVKKWSEIYGIEAVNVGVISQLMPEIE